MWYADNRQFFPEFSDYGKLTGKGADFVSLFTPSDPMNTYKTQKEIENWRAELEEKRTQEEKGNRRYWITTGISILSLVVSIIALTISILK